MSQTMSQSSMILRHLRERGQINPMEALERYGCYRLGARIHELRRDGYPIESETIMNGNRKLYAVYRWSDCRGLRYGCPCPLEDECEEFQRAVKEAKDDEG